MKRGVKKPSGGSGTIRIISGRWRGRKIPVLDVQGLRPTTDRTKETLFNWLMHDIQGKDCLDVFAGSGGLGLEALSRYANSVCFFELNKAAVKQLQQNLLNLGLTEDQAVVKSGDSLELLKQCNTQFDLIFLDPPFNQNLLDTCIEMIVSKHLLKPNGLIYIESESTDNAYAVPTDWQRIKQKQTQQVNYCLFQQLDKKHA